MSRTPRDPGEVTLPLNSRRVGYCAWTADRCRDEDAGAPVRPVPSLPPGGPARGGPEMAAGALRRYFSGDQAAGILLWRPTGVVRVAPGWLRGDCNPAGADDFVCAVRQPRPGEELRDRPLFVQRDGQPWAGLSGEDLTAEDLVIMVIEAVAVARGGCVFLVVFPPQPAPSAGDQGGRP